MRVGVRSRWEWEALFGLCSCSQRWHRQQKGITNVPPCFTCQQLCMSWIHCWSLNIQTHGYLLMFAFVFVCIPKTNVRGLEKGRLKKMKKTFIDPTEGKFVTELRQRWMRKHQKNLLKCCRVAGSLILCEDFRFGISTHVSIMQLLCASNIYMQRQ